MNEFRLNSVMRLGSLTLTSNLFLSPLAGYTNLPFRLVVREIGGVGLCTTDLVNARSLLEKNPKAFKLIETRPADSPLAVHVAGELVVGDAVERLAGPGERAVEHCRGRSRVGDDAGDPVVGAAREGLDHPVRLATPP